MQCLNSKPNYREAESIVFRVLGKLTAQGRIVAHQFWRKGLVFTGHSDCYIFPPFSGTNRKPNKQHKEIDKKQTAFCLSLFEKHYRMQRMKPELKSGVKLIEL